MRVMIDREGEHSGAQARSMDSMVGYQVQGGTYYTDRATSLGQSQLQGLQNNAYGGGGSMDTSGSVSNAQMLAGAQLIWRDMENANKPLPRRNADRLAALQSRVEAIRERRLNACETCTCAQCEEARNLPRVLRILAAAERRRLA